MTIKFRPGRGTIQLIDMNPEESFDPMAGSFEGSNQGVVRPCQAKVFGDEIGSEGVVTDEQDVGPGLYGHAGGFGR